MGGTAILILTQVPDHDCARALARTLVEMRLAACVSIGSPVDSLYHWRGKIETATEIPLVIKTAATRFGAVADEIRRQHPYELPEILAVPIMDGLRPYLDWIETETRADARA